jgi:cytoskeleton protein RodZ
MEDPIIKSGASGESDLKSLRVSKGLSLKDLFESTRISVINLEAIEQGAFHQLPPPIFTKAFIKSYAKAIGASSAEILARYEQYLETLNEPPKKADTKTHSEGTGKRRSHLLWGISILIVAGITAFSISSYKKNIDISKDQIAQPLPQTLETNSMPAEIKNEPASQVNPVSTPEEKKLPPTGISQMTPAVQKPADTPKPQQSDSRQVSANDQREGENYLLKMQAKELTWIRIKAGDSPSQQILLKPGEKIEQSASKFNIDIGNAGGVAVDFQGKPIENLGTTGQVVHLKLP